MAETDLQDVNDFIKEEYDLPKNDARLRADGQHRPIERRRTEADGERCAKSFQKQGFEGAVALPMNDKGNVRVAYELVMGREAALRRLEIIKSEYNEAAWLLRKK